jgi:hypothetical protein
LSYGAFAGLSFALAAIGHFLPMGRNNDFLLFRVISVSHLLKKTKEVKECFLIVKS